MKKHFFLLLYLLLLSACGIFDRMPYDISLAGKISHGFLEEVRCKYPYYTPFGIGGAFCDQINGFLLTFSSSQDISEKQAEADIRDMYQMLMDRVNKDEDIRPYLSEWPFEGKETSVGIIYNDPKDGRFRKYPAIASISIRAGKMRKTYFYGPADRLMSLEQIQKYEAKEDPDREKE